MFVSGPTPVVCRADRELRVKNNPTYHAPVQVLHYWYVGPTITCIFRGPPTLTLLLRMHADRWAGDASLINAFIGPSMRSEGATSLAHAAVCLDMVEISLFEGSFDFTRLPVSVD